MSKKSRKCRICWSDKDETKGRRSCGSWHSISQLAQLEQEVEQLNSMPVNVVYFIEES